MRSMQRPGDIAGSNAGRIESMILAQIRLRRLSADRRGDLAKTTPDFRFLPTFAGFPHFIDAAPLSRFDLLPSDPAHHFPQHCVLLQFFDDITQQFKIFYRHVNMPIL